MGLTKTFVVVVLLTSNVYVYMCGFISSENALEIVLRLWNRILIMSIWLKVSSVGVWAASMYLCIRRNSKTSSALSVRYYVRNMLLIDMWSLIRSLVFWDLFLFFVIILYTIYLRNRFTGITVAQTDFSSCVCQMMYMFNGMLCDNLLFRLKDLCLSLCWNNIPKNYRQTFTNIGDFFVNIWIVLLTFFCCKLLTVYSEINN